MALHSVTPTIRDLKFTRARFKDELDVFVFKKLFDINVPGKCTSDIYHDRFIAVPESDSLDIKN